MFSHIGIHRICSNLAQDIPMKHLNSLRPTKGGRIALDVKGLWSLCTEAADMLESRHGNCVQKSCNHIMQGLFLRVYCIHMYICIYIYIYIHTLEI